MVAEDFKKEEEGETFDDEDELEDWAISKKHVRRNNKRIWRRWKLSRLNRRYLSQNFIFYFFNIDSWDAQKLQAFQKLSLPKKSKGIIRRIKFFFNLIFFNRF